MIDTTTLAVVDDTTLLTRLSDALSVPNGTFTLNPRTGTEERHGYTTAVDPDAERYYAGRITHEDIAAYVAEHADQLTGTGLCVSGWRHGDTGVAYLYLTRVVGSARFAVEHARRHGHITFTSLAWGRADLI